MSQECIPAFIELVVNSGSAVAALLAVIIAVREFQEGRKQRAPYFIFSELSINTFLPEDIHPFDASTVSFLGRHVFTIKLQNIGSEPATDCDAIFAVLSESELQPSDFRRQCISKKYFVTDVPGNKEIILEGDFMFSTVSSCESTSLSNGGLICFQITYKKRSYKKKHFQLFVRNWDGTELNGEARELYPVENKTILKNVSQRLRELA